VRATRSVAAEGYRIRKDTSGTVVAVYDRGATYGATYAVEIADLPGGSGVMMLLADQIERMHGGAAA
jgi:hypothetical protein